MMQDLRVIKAQACEGFYNSKALHYTTIITNKGIYSILYGKCCDLTSLQHDANNFIAIVDCFIIFHKVKPLNCNNKAF